MNGMVNQQGNGSQIRELALFAGAGGGILGGKLLGWKTVCAVEINAYCAGILVQRQNDGILAPFPIWDDVRTFDGKPWRCIVDVVSGGFPCQDISAAGKGAGIDGERSGLWREMARIIGEVRPRFAFVENSPMLTSRGLGRVLGDLAEMGYDSRWCVLGCGDAGGLHERNRIWIFAHTNNRKKRNTRNFAKKIQRQQVFSWCKNVRRVEDFIERPDIYPPPLCRAYDGMAFELDQVGAIGNGQVPAVARIAFEILSEGITEWSPRFS